MNSELGRRIAFTLGALLIFRIGTFIPLPGIDLSVWEQFFRPRSGILGAFNMSSGGAAGRLAIFALGIAPYVSAAIILQLVSFFAPKLRALRGSGENGRRVIDRYTFALTLLLAAFQSYGIAIGLEGVGNLVSDPGVMFRVSTVVTLTGGAIFLVWLSDQITLRGFGNGIALFLGVGIVTALPQTILGTFELGQRGVFSNDLLIGLAAFSVALVGFVTFVEKARRRELVEFVTREDVRGSSYLVFKLNGAGIIPALIASWLLVLPVLFAAVMRQRDPFWWDAFAQAFGRAQPLYMLCYAVAIFFFVYLYTAFVLDPSDAAEMLKRCGGRIAQVEPGEATAQHIDRLLSRTTMIGALYFVVICLIPELLLYRAGVPFYRGGTSLLILVCTVLDIEKQARGYALEEVGG